jgi:hypothetical protein
LRAAERSLGTVELAQPIERGAPHAGLRRFQATPYATAARGLFEEIGRVQRPVDHRVAVTRLKPSGGTQQVIQSRRVGPQRATLPSSSTASMCLVLDPQLNGEASNRRQSSSASSIPTSSSSLESASHSASEA